MCYRLLALICREASLQLCPICLRMIAYSRVSRGDAGEKEMIFIQPSNIAFHGRDKKKADEAIAMIAESGCLDEEVESQRYVGGYSTAWVEEGRGATLANTGELPVTPGSTYCCYLHLSFFTWAPPLSSLVGSPSGYEFVLAHFDHCGLYISNHQQTQFCQRGACMDVLYNKNNLELDRPTRGPALYLHILRAKVSPLRNLAGRYKRAHVPYDTTDVAARRLGGCVLA